MTKIDKGILWFWGVYAVVSCGVIVGCEASSTETEQERQLREVPVLICEKDGVKLWKVEDRTRGGQAYVYFTSPNGGVINTKGK